MTAKWGKISLGCSILTFILSVAIIVMLHREEYLNHNCPICQGECMDIVWDFSLGSFLIWSLPVLPLSIVGALFADIGRRKKEAPTIYVRLGAILNVAWFLGILAFLLLIPACA